MLLERPTASHMDPTSAHACETLGGPFVVGIVGGEPGSYASKPAHRTSYVCLRI